jgi:tRNA (cytidine/uridine-2'-O-)-methyltransferase
VFHVILLSPQIPPNTGNIIRLCANTGADLHLVEPLGFEPDDARLRRAGLDYHEYARVRRHPNLDACLTALGTPRLWAFSTRGQRPFSAVDYHAGEALLFGAETSGLPVEVLAGLPKEQILRLPMRPGSRSLNLSNAVAVAVFEAWRQQGYAGAHDADQHPCTVD